MIDGKKKLNRLIDQLSPGELKDLCVHIEKLYAVTDAEPEEDVIRAAKREMERDSEDIPGYSHIPHHVNRSNI